jgi:DNA-binding SARP family transcriptional activator
MRFRILGPLEVLDEGRAINVGGPQQQALLAILLLHANRVVSTDRLVEHLWGDRAPSSARGLLQGCIAQLRRALQTGDRQPLLTRAPGYLLEVRAGELDRDRFEELVETAHALEGDESTKGLEERSALLTEALGLWHGPVLDGIQDDSGRVEALHLEERRLTVLEERIEIDLRLGRHAGVAGELRSYVRSHPLRERLWALLMMALARSDRQADALAAYRELRDTLVNQLGVEPSASVQELHRQILSGGMPIEEQPASVPPEARPQSFDLTVPAQLPAGTAVFTGRARALKRLDELLADAVDGVALGVISGTAGVGKTTVAVQWAHQVRERFPDGQLYVNLRGYSSSPPMRPIEALAAFLRALGVPADQVPVDPDQAAALYRTLLAGKRVLVVLDNAKTAEQVRPLLPGTSGCLVLVTSRERLGGLIAREGGQHLTLDVLDPEDASALLARLLGPERIAAEPHAAERLARLCARLPLALRIAAANLAFHQQGSIADQVADLVAGGRLNALQIGDDEPSAVRSAFDLSYEALDRDARKVFRRLGLIPGPDVSAGAAAALADLPGPHATAVLNRLVGAHLVDQPEPGRYVFHDLLRLYAAERAESEDDDAERADASTRLYEWYLDQVAAAARQLYPQVLRLHVPASVEATYPDPTAALAWLDAELPNLLAAIERTAAHGPSRYAWLLADGLRGYFWLRRNVVDWLAAARSGLVAAEREGDPRAQAAGHFGLGMAYLCLNRYPQVIEHQEAAQALSERAGWREGEANAQGNLAVVYGELGELGMSAALHLRALSVNREIGSRRGEAVNLCNLGGLYLFQGRLRLAGDYLSQAIRFYRDLGERHGLAVSTHQLGELYHRLGRYDEALSTIAEALAIYRKVGSVNGEGMALGALAAVHSDAGRQATAAEHVERALELVAGTSDRFTEAYTRNRLGVVRRRTGDLQAAIEQHTRALELARETSARHPEAEALIGLSVALNQVGRTDQALTHARHAVTAARSIGYQILHGQALTALATVLLDSDLPAATEHAGEALALHRETGYRLGIARTLAVLAEAVERAGDATAAAAHRREANALFADIGTPEVAG